MFKYTLSLFCLLLSPSLIKTIGWDTVYPTPQTSNRHLYQTSNKFTYTPGLEDRKKSKEQSTNKAIEESKLVADLRSENKDLRERLQREEHWIWSGIKSGTSHAVTAVVTLIIGLAIGQYNSSANK